MCKKHIALLLSAVNHACMRLHATPFLSAAIHAYVCYVLLHNNLLQLMFTCVLHETKQHVVYFISKKLNDQIENKNSKL